MVDLQIHMMRAIRLRGILRGAIARIICGMPPITLITSILVMRGREQHHPHRGIHIIIPIGRPRQIHVPKKVTVLPVGRNPCQMKYGRKAQHQQMVIGGHTM